MDAVKNFYISNGEIKKTKEWTDEPNGKVIYEVIRIINGKPLFYEEHYERMKNSFKLSNVEFKITEEELKEEIPELEIVAYEKEDIDKLVKANDLEIGNIKLTYNTTSKELRGFFIKHSYPTEEMYKDGVSTIIYFGERENPNAKVINQSFRDAVNNEIKKKDAYEAILIDRNGFITEGSRSNIFMIRDRKLYTSKVEAVLSGVTRTEIIKMAKNNGIEVIEGNVNYKNIKMFEGLFISGTSPKILPINKVDDIEFDVNNEFLRELMKKFDEVIENYSK